MHLERPFIGRERARGLTIEQAAPLQRITCLNRPSEQIDPPTGGKTLWRLVSHLSLNHLSLAEGTDSLRALREILRLCSRFQV